MIDKIKSMIFRYLNFSSSHNQTNMFDVLNSDNKTSLINDRYFNSYPMLLHRTINELDNFSKKTVDVDCPLADFSKE